MTITCSQLNSSQLGNQCFRYAMLRAVAVKHGREVALPWNLHGVKGSSGTLTELDKFCLRDWRPLRDEDAANITHPYQEASHRYDPKVFEQPDGTNYKGYFQCERYFKPIESRIREEFTFVEPIRSYAKQYVDGLRSGYDRVVSVHVRRGADCLANPHKFHIHTPDYFRRGMEQPEFTKGKTCYLVISDDQAWCETVFKGPENVRFCGTPSHWHDMAVMSHCDHHVISGSTFGWWGAWLNPSKRKIIVGPEQFFGDGFGPGFSDDVMPPGWRRIKL